MQNQYKIRIRSFIVCSVAVLTLLSGCGNSGVSTAGNKSEWNPDDAKAIVYDLDQTAKSGLYRSDDADYACLAGMEKKLENEYLELYLGKMYDIAVRDKETGHLFFSNKAVYDKNNEASAAEKAASYSQVSLEYYSSANQLLRMDSYPNSVDGESRNQVDVKVEGNKLLLNYRFGSQDKDRIIFSAISPDTYKMLDELAAKKMETEELSFNQYAKFTEMYLPLYYTDLSDADKASYSKSFPNFEKMGTLYVFPTDASDVKKNEIEKIFKILGVDKAALTKEHNLIGITEKISTAKTPYFEIPVVYQLQGRDFVASVDNSKIKQESGFMMTRIYLLNSFHSVSPDKDGYLFIPDGSGAVIENKNINELTKLDLPFYGSDFSVDVSRAEMVKPYASLPVFGIKSENAAVFGIVENGDGLGGVQVQMANSFNPYNSVSPWFTYLTQDTPVDEIMSAQETIVTNYVYSKKVPKTYCSVRYHFLYGDSSTYSGMAKYYQTYLKQTGSLGEMKKPENLTLDLNILGAVTKKKMVLGIPRNVETAASTFADVQKMSEDISKSGITDFNILYQGAINGGMNFMAPLKVKIEPTLGGKSGLLSLQESLASRNATLALSIDFTKVYKKGNGLNTNNQLSTFPNKKFAMMTRYYSNTKERDLDTAAYVVNPLSYLSIVNSFMADFAGFGTKKIYAASLASVLNGNYNEKYEITREEGKYCAIQALKTLKSAGYEITADGGNAYALKYINHLVDLPVDYSNYSIESYSVPFAAMVVRGYLDYSGPLLNQQGDYRRSLLKNIENGAGLNYLLMTGDELILAKTAYSDYYSVSTVQWLPEVIKTYTKLSRDFKAVNGCTMTGHRKITKNVFETTYSNGTRVLVNYGEEPFTVDNNTVNSMDYLFLSGS